MLPCLVNNNNNVDLCAEMCAANVGVIGIAVATLGCAQQSCNEFCIEN
jgi:hypothetical protein